jgi:hypothetical protein
MIIPTYMLTSSPSTGGEDEPRGVYANEGGGGGGGGGGGCSYEACTDQDDSVRESRTNCQENYREPTHAGGGDGDWDSEWAPWNGGGGDDDDPLAWMAPVGAYGADRDSTGQVPQRNSYLEAAHLGHGVHILELLPMLGAGAFILLVSP